MFITRITTILHSTYTVDHIAINSSDLFLFSHQILILSSMIHFYIEVEGWRRGGGGVGPQKQPPRKGADQMSISQTRLYYNIGTPTLHYHAFSTLFLLTLYFNFIFLIVITIFNYPNTPISGSIDRAPLDLGDRFERTSKFMFGFRLAAL